MSQLESPINVCDAPIAIHALRIDGSRSALTDAPLQTPLRIRHIAFALVRDHCADVGVAEGAEVTRLDDASGRTILELSSHRRIEIARAIGKFIEVETLPAT